MQDTPSGGSGAADAATQLAAVRIDEETWTAASPERQREWRVVLDELVAEHCFRGALPARFELLVTAKKDRVELTGHASDAPDDAAKDVANGEANGAVNAASEGAVSGAPGDAVINEVITITDMERHLREYMRICIEMGQLAEGANSPNLEALDIAKRLVHNESAKTVQRLLKTLRPDHATARMMFTLLVTLHFDTTRLVRPHHLDAALEERSLRERRSERGR